MMTLKQHYTPLRVLLVAGSAAQAAVLSAALAKLRPAGDLATCAQMRRAVTEYQRSPYDVVLVVGANKDCQQVLGQVFRQARQLNRFVFGGVMAPGRSNIGWCAEAGQVSAPATWTPEIAGALALKLRSIQTFRQLWVGYNETTCMQLAMLEHIRDGVLLLDGQDRVLHANREAEELLGLPRAELLGRAAPELLVNPEPRSKLVSAIPPMQVPGRPDWRLLMFRLGVTVGSDDDSPALLQDVLTGLPTNILMQDRLAKAVQLATRYSRNLGLLRIQPDEQVLAQVNETYGFTAGDLVLRELATRLSGAVRTVDTVSRGEGSGFVAVLQELSQPDDGLIVAQRMQAAAARPFQLEEDVQLEVPVYIGMACYPEHGKTALDLLARAAIGVSRARLDTSGSRVGVFSVEVADTTDRDVWEARLLTALEQNDLLLYFQPKISMTHGRVVGAEALLRWTHEGTVKTPEKLLPVAEELGLLGQITEWVVREAARQAAAWHAQGRAVPIAVNIPPSEFSADLLHLVESVQTEFNLPPHLLELEVIESAMGAQQHADSFRVMQALADKGIHLFLDDFGTGYSSLDRLKTFPLRALKIDRVFVRALQGAHLGGPGAIICTPDASKDVAILRAIVALARNLDLETVVEGIEHAEQLAVLRELGIDTWQGFLASRALPPDLFVTWQDRWEEQSGYQ